MDIQLSANVFTEKLDAIQNWLTKYFGFRRQVDWVDTEQKGGRVICERDGIEITICGVFERTPDEIKLLVDDLTALCEQFERDGIEHHVDRDAGERPIIYFPQASPFSHFVIEEIESDQTRTS